MKLPPVLVEKVATTDSAARSERDRSFLIFASIVLVSIAAIVAMGLLGTAVSNVFSKITTSL